MPMLFVQTNVSSEKLPSTINNDLTDIVSSALGKPKIYIFVSVQHVPSLTFQGLTDPAALVELKSIGFSNKVKVVNDVTEYLNKHGVPAQRVGMTLVDLKPNEVAIGGNLFG